MSVLLDIRVTEKIKKDIKEIANENSLTVTNIVKSFVLDCVKNNKLPFSITDIPTFKEAHLDRFKINFGDNLDGEVESFKKLCKRSFTNPSAVIRTYLFLCCNENKILIKPDFESGFFCERSYSGFKEKSEKYKKLATYRKKQKK